MAVLIGKNLISGYQEREIDAGIHESIDRDYGVIVVLLPECPRDYEPGPFLKAYTRVDFRCSFPDPIQQLHQGITHWQSHKPAKK